MKSYSAINLKNLGKLLKRDELKARGKDGILKSAKIRSATWSVLNRLARKIEFKGSITNKNKWL